MDGESETRVVGFERQARKGVPPRLARRVLALDDFEPLARRRLPRPLFGYAAGGAEENRSLAANRAAFGKHALQPRVLRDVSGRSTAVEFLGQRWAAPFGIAPLGMAAMSAYRADIVLARGARAMGIPAALSGASLIRLEDVARAAPGTWFQAYLPGEIARIDALLDRAVAAGYETLLVTVDLAVGGNRENHVRAGFSAPLRPTPRLAFDGLVRPRWLLGTFARTLLRHGMPHFENAFGERGAPIISRRAVRDFARRDHFDWRHVDHIRRRWQGPLILKGILHPDDAAEAKARGADAIVVSNHGGRQLDGAVAPLDALPGIVSRAGDLPVLLDGGVRRGTDVVKALALGARLVLVGRPFLYAAVVAGEAGVVHAADILRTELDRDLALLGLNSVAEIGPDILFAHPDRA
ncbi:MAG: alpha-hydroxy acid oxidase [Azospirillaceae bacterium]